MRKHELTLFLGGALFIASAAVAQTQGDTIILSDKYGRGMTIGSQQDRREAFSEQNITSADLVGLFDAACLKTNLAPEGAIDALASAGLQPRTVALPADRKIEPRDHAEYGSGAMVISGWAGDETGLKGRPIIIRERGVNVVSGYGPFKASGKQCNLDAKLASFDGAAVLVEQLSIVLGSKPNKVVDKPGFADGFWDTTLNGEPVKVSFYLVDLKKPTPLLHMVAQRIEEKKK